MATGKSPLKIVQVRTTGSLNFLKEFMGATNTTLTKLAEILNCTSVNASYIFRNDDIKVSFLYRIFEAKGYNLQIDMVKEPDETMEYKDLDPESIILLPNGRYKFKNIAFLTNALRQSKIKKTEFIQKMGMSKYSMKHWISEDEISWSRVMQAANVLGLNVRITATKIVPPLKDMKTNRTKDETGAESPLKIFFSMNIEDSIPIPNDDKLWKRWKRKEKENSETSENPETED